MTEHTQTAELLAEPTLTIPQAGRVLGISRQSAYQAAQRGEIPVIVIGRRRIVPTARLRAMLGIGEAAD